MSAVQRIQLAYNNVYALEAASQTVLIDTGPDYRGAREHIADELGDVRPALVVASHGHLDHAGLGSWWESRGVPVMLHNDDAHFPAGRQIDEEELANLQCFVEHSGAPPDVVAEATYGLEQRREWWKTAASAVAYRPAGRDGRWPTALRYEPFSPSVWADDAVKALPGGAEFLHMPGHTPGNAVVWFAAEGWLFSGDQLLPEITPTPAIQGHHRGGPDWRFRSLPHFLRSLERVRELGATRCFPGHGEPFDNVAQVIDANLGQAQQRTAKLAEALRDGQGQTLYGLAEAAYPRALRRRFWQIIATVQGHLDVLEALGEARASDGRWYRA